MTRSRHTHRHGQPPHTSTHPTDAHKQAPRPHAQTSAPSARTRTHTHTHTHTRIHGHTHIHTFTHTHTHTHTRARKPARLPHHSATTHHSVAASSSMLSVGRCVCGAKEESAVVAVDAARLGRALLTFIARLIRHTAHRLDCHCCYALRAVHHSASSSPTY